MGAERRIHATKASSPVDSWREAAARKHSLSLALSGDKRTLSWLGWTSEDGQHAASGLFVGYAGLSRKNRSISRDASGPF